jgi:hypothetical protein
MALSGLLVKLGRGDGAKMIRITLLAMAVWLLAGCERPAVAVLDPCRPPTLPLPEDAAGTYAGETERVTLCVKVAVRDLDRVGGSVEQAAQAAVVRCAPQEAAEVAALARREPVYQWEKDQIHDKLEHLALINARQARSRGCGRPGGAPEDL